MSSPQETSNPGRRSRRRRVAPPLPAGPGGQPGCLTNSRSTPRLAHGIGEGRHGPARPQGVPLMIVKKSSRPMGGYRLPSCSPRYAVCGQSKRAQMVRAMWSPMMPQSVARAPMMSSPW
jgi:hypothetical protein